MTVEQRLADLGVNLPSPAAPAANYVPFLVSGNQLFISGQLPFLADGSLHAPGRLGDGVSVEDGKSAAKLCAIGILAQAKVAVGGDWSKIARIVKLGAFVNCTPDFVDQPMVVNGASDFMVDVLGDKGRHSRSAVGAASLPFGVPVEIDAVIELAS
jgi:enamine deaminase RidA (YjgF/YER057c/UK114 family)